MASILRTTSHEQVVPPERPFSAAPYESSETSRANDLCKVPSASSVASAATTKSTSTSAPRMCSRSTSHSLLSTSAASSATSRNGGQTDPERAADLRGSSSLPLLRALNVKTQRSPAALPKALELGTSRAVQSGEASPTPDGSQTMPEQLSALPRKDRNTNRTSISSFLSIESSGPTLGNPGAASSSSSNAGSIRTSTGLITPASASVKGDVNAAANPPSPSLHGRNFETIPGSLPMRDTTRSRSRAQRRPSGTNASGSGSPNSEIHKETPTRGIVGVCALDVKARSKPSRNILTRLQSEGPFEVIVFGDKVILDENVENWPICDFLISFYSDGFPLDKAIAYNKLRHPFCVNDLEMQRILWDRRLCLRILDALAVPTPKRIEVSRDGGPRLESAELAKHVREMSGVRLEGPEDGTGGGMAKPRIISMTNNNNTLVVDGKTLSKPFVEKPVSGEDHNIHIYFPKDENGKEGGGRRLFRKIGNKSSEWDDNLCIPRALTDTTSSYIYEQFLQVDNAEDVKAYTVGSDFCHAETRKSPVVDGIVRRNTFGKEIRYVTSLSKAEKGMASRIVSGFGQRICGFDLLRTGDKSFVIDVNGWSFVKDNNDYYDRCAKILKETFVQEKERKDWKAASSTAPSEPSSVAQSLKGEHRKSALGQVAKTILKTPSMSRIGTHLHHQKAQHSPEQSAGPSPDCSPIPTDSSRTSTLPPVPTNASEALPPPVVPSSAANVDVESTTPSPDAGDVPPPSSKHTWKLKGTVTVIRHADRTPKQKFKFTFHSQPFVDLLKGHQEEVLLKGEAALKSVATAVNLAIEEKSEDMDKLRRLSTALARKGAWPGTKVQIKPMFRKRRPSENVVRSHGGSLQISQTHADLSSQSGSSSAPDGRDINAMPDIGHDPEHTRSESVSDATFSRYSAAEGNLVLDKLQLVIKWGGEPTHSARYQAQDLGENMRNDLLLLNKEALDNIQVFTSSERRVATSAQIWASSFLNTKDIPEGFIRVRKNLLDDSNAAKDEMDKVKKKLKVLLREGHERPPQFAWPEKDTPEPSVVLSRVVELMQYHRRILRDKFARLNGPTVTSPGSSKSSESTTAGSVLGGALAQAQAINTIQGRWCSGEDAILFKERWEKLFKEFCDTEKVDPSKISELYDSMKFDALHNRQFLKWVFRSTSGTADPRASLKDEERPSESALAMGKSERNGDVSDKSNGHASRRIDLRRRSFLSLTNPTVSLPTPDDPSESYFKLFTGDGKTKAKADTQLENLRELYRLAKILFDFIGPQEYGIEDSEKLEIGLLTSLPLLREIVDDLEELQASDNAKSFVYFTKESHVYTLLNCILEGGIKTKISRNAIPELDYLSQIAFELYEAEDPDTNSFEYSIRISISPGCHTFDPLDVDLDSKHCIGCAPRRSLTAHHDWKEVIETLRAKFDSVKLPKSFLAVNLSDKHLFDSSSGEESKILA